MPVYLNRGLRFCLFFCIYVWTNILKNCKRLIVIVTQHIPVVLYECMQQYMCGFKYREVILRKNRYILQYSRH